MKSSSENAFTKINVPVVSSGVLRWDAAMSQGGIPRGKIVEIFGDTSTGKSALCLTIAKSFLDMGEEVFYIDCDILIDTAEWINRLGCHKLLHDDRIVYPLSTEFAFDHLLQLASFADCIILDSASALIPYAELNGGKHNYKTIPRMMNRAIQQLIPIIKKSGCTIIFTSQIRYDKQGNLKSSGGEALEHNAALRLELSIEKYIQETRDNNGNLDYKGMTVRFNTIKNTIGTSDLVIAPFYFGYDMPAGFEQVENENEFRQRYGLPIKQERIK